MFCECPLRRHCIRRKWSIPGGLMDFSGEGFVRGAFVHLLIFSHTFKNSSYCQQPVFSALCLLQKRIRRLLACVSTLPGIIVVQTSMSLQVRMVPYSKCKMQQYIPTRRSVCQSLTTRKPCAPCDYLLEKLQFILI